MYLYKKDYGLCEVECKNTKRYFASFKDIEGIYQKIEVSESIYLVLLHFNRMVRNCQRWNERHSEKSELTEVTLYDRTFMKHKSVEQTIIDKMRDEQLWLAIRNLPHVQKRRLLLYYFNELTYTRIAKREGCSIQAVNYSIDIAKIKIKNFLRKRL